MKPPMQMPLSMLHRVCCFFFFTLAVTLRLQFSVSGLNQEGFHLQRLKLFLSDPNGVFSSWSESDPTPCNWTGIECGGGGSVVSISLPGSSLAGPFPGFICRLQSLKVLNLSNNYINSSLPLSISKCRNLTSLDLSQNLLGGPIPHTLSGLHDLRHLDLSYCYFSGKIPASFGRFRSLETLDFTDNKLKGTIPAILGNITSLKSIELAYNSFSPGQLPAELGNLTNLENLWVGGCNLVGPIPESVGKLSRLTNFDVSNNNLTGSIPSTISHMRSIVQIEMYNNSLTGKLPARWSNLTELRRFDASMNLLTGTIPSELCELPLESLNLYQNYLEGSLPDSIANSPNLQDLRLFQNRLVGSMPSQLGANSPLRLLDVSDNSFNGTLPEGLCSKGSLKELSVINNAFSGNIPANLGRCRSLSRIRLRLNKLYGEVPGEFFSLPYVYMLDLNDNGFSGNISRMISGAKNLSSLQISRNRFSGSIPSEIGSLVNLVQFSARQNQLQGEIPHTLLNLKQLMSMDLSNNKLSGEIPKEFQSMKQLLELNLANNELSGEVPEGIGSLQGLHYLDLSGNHFSGNIPSSLEKLYPLTLNLSNNQFSGEIPPSFENSMYWDSFLGNPGLGNHTTSSCSSKTQDKHKWYIWLLRIIYAMAAIVFLLGVVFFIWKYNEMKEESVGLLKWTSFYKFVFSESEILDCLDEANMIGNGASGKVYKVNLSNGETVAVKKLGDKGGDFENDEFDIEVETLGKIRHKNIVKLWCCCDSVDLKLLVYEYMPNGSLGDLLHSFKGGSLDWPSRFKIASEAAHGLSYLHHDCVPPIIHRDIKSNNILLNKDFGAKISDFGVAKILNKDCPTTVSFIAGSYGYIAPEYAYTLHVNERSDIYSFGVVMLELVTGRRAVDLVNWVSSTMGKNGGAADKVVDPNLDSSFREHISKVLHIALFCVTPNPVNRPSMRTVVKLLQESKGDFVQVMGEKETKLS